MCHLTHWLLFSVLFYCARAFTFFPVFPWRVTFHSGVNGLRPYTPRNHNRGTLYFKYFLSTNLREIPAVCGQTSLLFRGGSSLGTMFTSDHQWLDSDQRYHALCNYRYEQTIIVYFFAKANVALRCQFIGQF